MHAHPPQSPALLNNSKKRVAVKLQHPALAEWIPLDMALTRFAFTNIKYFFPEYPLTWLSDEMEASWVSTTFRCIVLHRF